MKKPTGFIVYEGPSLLDGAPIVAIALTGKSSNRKTGGMVQTYILRQDVHPCEAVKDGRDASICGDCKHRPSTGGACYVVVPQGPTSVWKTYQRGGYPKAEMRAQAFKLFRPWAGNKADGAFYASPIHLLALGDGRAVRLGTYGDPAAVPAWIWRDLTGYAVKRTGYTHQWRTVAGSQRDTLRALCMASVDSEAERLEAHAAGWRTFRVMLPDEALGAGEFACPASEEAGKRTTCERCGACSGASRGTAQASPAILAHGAKARRFIAVRAV